MWVKINMNMNLYMFIVIERHYYICNMYTYSNNHMNMSWVLIFWWKVELIWEKRTKWMKYYFGWRYDMIFKHFLGKLMLFRLNIMPWWCLWCTRGLALTWQDQSKIFLMWMTLKECWIMKPAINWFWVFMIVAICMTNI